MNTPACVPSPQNNVIIPSGMRLGSDAPEGASQDHLNVESVQNLQGNP
jgi:hypothetical protein